MWTRRWGFMFAGYEPEYTYWEIFVMLRKALFVIATVFLGTKGPVAQVVAAMIILTASLSANLIFEPYDHDDHDFLETISLQASILMLAVSLLANEFSRYEGYYGGSLSFRDSCTVGFTIICSTFVLLFQALRLTLRHSLINN